MSNIEEAKRRIRKCIDNQETELDLSNLGLTDLEKEVPELKECTDLVVLNLIRNRIRKFSSLANLANLTELYLGANLITDISSIANITNLTKLHFQYNIITDISPLANLFNLTKLNCHHNQIVDISSLADLSNLKELDLTDNQIVDILPLANLSNLKELDFADNQIDDILALANLSNLKELDFADNQIDDISPLANLLKLTKLNCHHNQIVDISSLADLSNLKELDLTDNQIDDISPLANLSNLKELDLADNQIDDISPLANLCNLTKLNCFYNQIVDISPLANLSNLKELNITNNQIIDISPLANLANLTELFLGINQINDISSLANLTNLTKLSLHYNQITDVSPLANLINLKKLEINNNQTTNFTYLLENTGYKIGQLIVDAYENPDLVLNKFVNKGYKALKVYYDTLNAEGKIQNDQLKVILLGNSTAGKTSLVNYWGNKTFDEKQTTTHGIYTPIDLPLNYQAEDSNFRVNVWDFGGQDYYHATHRLFVTRESTYVLVCNKHLEDKPAQELTTEYMQVGEEVRALEVPVQHYPYRYWLQTLAFLTQSGKIDDPQNQAKAQSQLPKLFLVENKCGIEHEQYRHNQRMRLDEKLSQTLPFEVLGGDFYHIDIQKAYQYHSGEDTQRSARRYYDAYEEFEEQLLQTLRTQIENNRYEVHANFPKIRDILASMAAHMQNREPSPELNEYLVANKIAPIESYPKLPVWISYDEYRDIVERNSKSKFEDIEGFLHTYLQNLCGRIFHFKDIPSLAHIVFIDPNWLHQTIYKVLNQKVLDNKGEFTIHDADAVIDGNIIQAATFLDAMKAFDLIFEIPNQDPRRFVAPQYLPEVCPLHTAGLYSLVEENYELALTLEFSYYLPSSLISRIISKKGHLIKNRQQFLWRNGLLYTDENQVSVLIECKPTERRIEVSLNKKDKNQIQQTLRELMTLLEENFSDEIADAYVVLPAIKAKAKWKHLLKSKEGRQNKVINYEEQGQLVEAEPFWFLFREFERKPLNVFVCYSHEDQTEMEAFTHELTKQLNSFEKQHGIKINKFTDLELKTGMLWDTVLQERIAQNDVLICLLSPTFFTSSYIQEKEYGKMKQLAQQNPNKLIAPIYVKSCYISEDNEIANLQFYKPLASRFGLSQSIKEFSFSNLLHHNGGSYVQNYVKGFVEEIGGRVLGGWEGR